jgi:hypothetical protein
VVVMVVVVVMVMVMVMVVIPYVFLSGADGAECRGRQPGGAVAC